MAFVNSGSAAAPKPSYDGKKECTECGVPSRYGSMMKTRDRFDKVIEERFVCSCCIADMRAGSRRKDRYGKGTDTEGFGHSRW